MEILKAIEIMDLNIKENGRRMPPDVKDAITTLIAAGNLVLQAEAVLSGRNGN